MAATEIQQGIAKIFAMDGAVITGAATITMESADFEQTFDSAELLNQRGEVETLVASNERYTCTINFVPNGATRAAAITSCANSQPAKITKVELSGFSLAIYNGNWNSMGYSISMKHNATDPVRMTLRLWTSAVPANRASLTAGVIVG